MEARIYLRTSYHGLRKAEGCYCGILEADTSKGEQTLEETGSETGTANQIALLGLIKAMEHMRRASDLEIFTDSKYLESGVNRFLDDWIPSQEDAVMKQIRFTRKKSTDATCTVHHARTTSILLLILGIRLSTCRKKPHVFGLRLQV